ncbi:GDSL-type esterase/lipase family protein [Parasphingorhabdus pacifica]
MMRAHLSKLLILLLVCGVLAVVILVSDRRLPDPPVPPAPLPPAVVTLGDSTMSGEGGGDYEPGTNGANGNWCHRSAAAPVHQMRLPPDVTPINLACSGARAEHVGSQPSDFPEEPQALQLAELTESYRITAVVVQVGANDDPAFIDAVNRCVNAWANRSPEGCVSTLRSAWPERVEQMTPKVIAALQDVREVMDRAGYTREGYSLIVQSYPSPVGPGIPPELQNLSGCPFLTRDLEWIRDIGVIQLSDGLREAAEAVDARFLDLSRAGRGHEACTAGTGAPRQEWFTRLTVDWESLQNEYRAPHAMQESFHANATGYAHMGRCMGEFLTSRETYAACLPDGSGELHPVSHPVAAQP